MPVAWVLCCCGSLFRLFGHAWVLFRAYNFFFVCFVDQLIFFCLYCNAYLLLLCLTTFLQVTIYVGCMSFWRLLLRVCFSFDCLHTICGSCFMFCVFVDRFSYFLAKWVWTWFREISRPPRAPNHACIRSPVPIPPRFVVVVHCHTHTHPYTPTYSHLHRVYLI